jgi:hypothetical protein
MIFFLYFILGECSLASENEPVDMTTKLGVTTDSNLSQVEHQRSDIKYMWHLF